MAKKKKIHFKYNLREYWSFLRKYKLLLAVLIFTIILQNSISILDKLFIKYIVDKGTEFTVGTLARELFVKILIIILILYGLVVLIKSVTTWVRIDLVNKLDAKLIMDLKKKYFNHLIHLSHNFHATHKSGQIISRLIRGSGTIEGFTDNILWNFAPFIIQFFVIVLSLAYLEWASALVMFVIMIVFISYSYYFTQLTQESNLDHNESQDYERASLADFLTNIDSIRYFSKEDYIKKRYEKHVNKTRLAAIRHWDYFRWLDSGQWIILSVGTIFLLYFPIMGILNGTTTIGTLVFISTIYGQIIGHLFGAVQGLRNFYRHMADFESLFAYGKIKNDIVDKHHAKDLKITRGEIEFEDITFAYPQRKTLFKNFNLDVRKNQKVALVGRSGSGKTTLVKLLYRLYDTQGGRILIDGKDITDIKQESLRSELSIVPQECILFDDTIYNNIAFSRPGASKKDVWAAIKAAQLEELIGSLPKRERTIVGERGVKLSGGEKQRVSIARAILADKKILILDEATSAMDSETEAAIQKALENLIKGRTSLMIAHRLSTIMKADKIIVFEEGNIVQSGRHNDLIKEKGQYKKLWNLQKGGYIE